MPKRLDRGTHRAYDGVTMTSQVLADILEKRVGCTPDGDRRVVPDDRETTVYVALGQETLILDKVVAFELATEVVVISTRKDHYVLAYEDVRGVRYGRGKSSAGY